MLEIGFLAWPIAANVAEAAGVVAAGGVQTMAILVANVSRKNEGWPKLLSCWGLGDLQVINRDVHVSKCYFSKLRNALECVSP